MLNLISEYKIRDKNMSIKIRKLILYMHAYKERTLVEYIRISDRAENYSLAR